jgi:glycosyltransferase involved in cell wall biosynthesis
MKIGIDIRCLAKGGRTGVEEYTLQLLYNLFEIDKKNEYILFLNAYKKIRLDLSWIKKYPNVKLKKFHFPNKLLNLFFWYFSWPKIDKLLKGVDIFFMPNIIFGGVGKKTKLILTIHDLSFEKYPSFFSLKRRWWHLFINPRKICRQAEKIITVSNSTARDIARVYKIKSDKIYSISSAIPDHFKIIDKNSQQLIEIKEKYNLPFKFILFLGTIEPRKNIIGLIRAYDKLQEFAEKTNDDELKKYKLVIAGAKGWLSEKIFSEIKNSKFREKIILPGFIGDKDKAAIYNLATLFVYPSFYEGFGFPPLEAMGCGLPVITSNNSSLPEICNNAAISIDPDKPDEIFESIKKILSDKKLYQKMIEDGLNNSKKFNWENTARKTLEVFKKAVSKNG